MMSQVVRRSLQCCLTRAVKLDKYRVGGAPALVVGSNHFGVVDCSVPDRGIKNGLAKIRYVLNSRRAKEKFKNPERYEKPNPRYTYTDWNYKAELFAFGSRVSEKFDDELLREALTDQSYIHQERKKQEELGIDTESLEIKSNLELAATGAKLAEQSLTAFLQKEFPKFPEDGRRALLLHLTSNKTIAEVGANLGLKDLILCEEYPPSEETYSRAMCAVIGAVANSSGPERAEKFVIDFIASLLCGKDVNEIWDVPRPWALMEGIAKQRNLTPVEPRLISQAGPNTIHAVFVVGIYDKDKKFLGKGIGETLDIAQEMAARDVLKDFFNTHEPRAPFQFQSDNIPLKLIPHVRNISSPY